MLDPTIDRPIRQTGRDKLIARDVSALSGREAVDAMRQI
jgi:hypothetical protein